MGNISDYRVALKGKILDTALTLFFAKGIKAVKMDDIAKSLSISKRTLYELYDNKEILLFECLKMNKTRKDADAEKALEKCTNVMDVLLETYRMSVEEFKRMSPIFFSEISRYPQVIEFIDKKREQDHEQFILFIERGKGEGFFRDDINYELLMKTHEYIRRGIVEEDLYNKYGIDNLFFNLIFVTFRGICTQKGVEVLDKYLKGCNIK